MALSIMVKFTKPGRLIAQTSYLGRFKPLKKFGKSFLKSVKVYRRILDLAHCALAGVLFKYAKWQAAINILPYRVKHKSDHSV